MVGYIYFFSLVFSFFWLSYITIILLRNAFEFTSISEESKPKQTQPFVSVCIPARNEENSIGGCVSSFLAQTYPNIEILVLNDHSTDATGPILTKLASSHSRLHLPVPKELPKGWLGKNWACHQLSMAASGEILVFADADTRAVPDFISSLVGAFEHRKVDAVTIWPHQVLGSFWEKVLVPMIYYSLAGMLFARYTYAPPRWLPPFLRQKFAPMFAAACGQCFAFTRTAYDTIGGHQSVKSEVVEDVQLAKRIREHHLSLKMYTGTTSFFCRMYTSYDEIKQGFRKNFFAGFGYNFAGFIAMGILHFIVYILPWIIFFHSAIKVNFSFMILSFFVILLPVIQRLWLSLWLKIPSKVAVFHILGVIWFEYLALLTMKDRLWGTKIIWKEREFVKDDE